MARLLIYIFPLLIDMVLGVVFFVCAVRMAESGASATAVTLVVTAWAITYMVSCHIVGKLVTPGNSAKMLVATTLFMGVLSVTFASIDTLWVIYLLMPLQAVSVAFFFPPFQVYMKAAEKGQKASLVRATGLYTFSWSSGIAAGPFVAGYLWEFAGWRWCHALNAVLAFMTAICIIAFRDVVGRGGDSAGEDESAEADDSMDYSSMPDLAWLGWVASGVGCFAVAVLRGVFPTTAAGFDIPKPSQGTVFALMSGTQALVGLYLCRSRMWMYRAFPVVVMGMFGIAALVLFGMSQKTTGFYLAAVCFGLYSGTFYFYLVFHSLVHPEKSARYISINESVVGLSSIAGPLIGGLIADYAGMGMPYFFAAGLIVCAIMLQAVIHSRPIPDGK